MENQNQVIVTEGTQEQNAGTGKHAKQSLKDRILKGYHKFRSTKMGKWTVRGLKGIGLAGFGYGSYKLGQKSVKPTVVTIEHGTEEDDPVEEETPTEEPVEEEKTEE